MHDWVEKLLELQEQDLRAAKLREQVESVPAETTKIQQMLSAADEVVKASEEQVLVDEKAIRQIDMETEDIRAKMRDFQTKSAMIKDNVDYKAAMLQIEGCQKRIRDLEDRELELMEDLEASREVTRQRQKEREATKARAASMTDDLQKRVERCTGELERLESQRADAINGIPSKVLRRYERLRPSPRLRGRVFVPVRDGVCDGCHMNVTYQARVDARKGLEVSCENCNALLYAED